MTSQPASPAHPRREFLSSSVKGVVSLAFPLPLSASAQGPALAEPRDKEGFRLPATGFKPRLPRDHGAHPDFKLEWWYVTGHLSDDAGEFHGFQITFFRRASAHGRKRENTILFDDSELHLAHTALLDVSRKTFLHDERVNRRGWDADAHTEKLDVRNGNWSLRAASPDQPNSPLLLDARIRGTHHLKLQLVPIKPLVVFGENGVSKKGASDAAASHYLTYSRLKAEGHLIRNNRPVLKLEGTAWMDHEISSSQLDPSQVGWDWLGIQMDDGREIMVYVLRKADGTPDPESKLTWVSADGHIHPVGHKSFILKPKGQWKSPVSGATYPGGLLLECPDPESETRHTFEIIPRFQAQEITSKLGRALSYWEGACEVREHGIRKGNAYMELTGYGKAMTEVLK
jgi:predicted secreted hydrolase